MIFSIIGCGYIGQKRAATLKNHKIKYFCDIDLKKARDLALKYKCSYTSNWEQILKDKEVEVVIISTTNDMLAKITKEAIKNEKYVLVEKPAARHKNELKEFPYYPSTRKVKVGFNLRYHPAICRAKKIIEYHRLGDIMYIRAKYGHGGRLGYEKEWRFNKEISGGGELIDQGVHLIDLARYFLEDVKLISGETKNYFWGTDLEDNAFINLENDKGSKAWLHVSCTEWKNIFCFEIMGTKGKLQIDGLGGSYGKEKLTWYKMLPDMKPPKITTWEFNEDVSWQNEMDDFIKCIEEKKVLNGNCYDAYETLMIVDEIYDKEQLC